VFESILCRFVLKSRYMNEIEIRGKLDKSEFEKLTAFLSKNAKLSDQYKRLTVDISPGFDPKTRNWDQVNKRLNNTQIDLRLKKSGRSEKIVIKIGYYASKNREEYEIKIKEGEFINALKLFEALGYRDGMIYEWKSRIYEYKEFEIKLSEYPNGYREWEIESQNQASDPNYLADTLSLKSYTEEEFQKEISWKNNHLHDLYSLKKVAEILKKWK
jgi:hypothetical protein